MKPRFIFVFGAILAGAASLFYLFMPVSLMALLGITVYLNDKIS